MKRIINFIVILVLFSLSACASCESFEIDSYNYLPFKNQYAKSSWSIYMNENYESFNGDWDESINDDWSFKCLSYASSSVMDWFILQSGGVLGEYQSYVRGETEEGTNPRLLENIFHERNQESADDYSYAKFFGNLRDPLTNEKVPHIWSGYAEILSNPPSNYFNEDDLNTPNLNQKYSYNDELKLIQDFIKIDITNNKEENIIKALKRYGILYASEYSEKLLLKKTGVHAIAIVGYSTCGGVTEFYYHDSDDYKNTKYDLTADKIKEVYAFVPNTDWPMYRHDNRRSGFTLLKGNLDPDKPTRKAINIALGVMDDGYDQMFYSRSSIADINNNGYQDIVMTYSLRSLDAGKLVVVEKDYFGKVRFLADIEMGEATSLPPTVADVNNDGQNDIIVNLDDGKMVIYSLDGNTLVEKDSFYAPARMCEHAGEEIQGVFGSSAVADIDNNGKNDILVTEETALFCEGALYDIEYDEDWNQVKFKTKLLGANSIGAHGNAAVAIANIDSDPEKEVVVPTFVGLRVFDYNNGDFEDQCNPTNTDAMISGTPVIYDINRDGKYEIVYPTVNSQIYSEEQYSGLEYENEINIVDASTCSVDKKISLPSGFMSKTSIGIANFDDDESLEMVVVGYINGDTSKGKVYAFEYSSESEEWRYPLMQNYFEVVHNAPNIADMNGADYYEIILATSEKSITLLNSEDGTRYENGEFNVEGLIGSTPVIGDVNGDYIADLTVKRSGSPIRMITTLTGENHQPRLYLPTHDIKVLSGEVIDLNHSNEFYATDEDGDQLSFAFSEDFNSSGQWLTNESDAGADFTEYNVTVQVFDNETFDIGYIKVTIFNESKYTKQTTFANNETSIQKTIGPNVIAEFQIHYHKDKIVDKQIMKISTK